MPNESEQRALSQIKDFLEAGHSLDALRQAGWADWITYLTAEGYDLRTGEKLISPPLTAPPSVDTFAVEPIEVAATAQAETNVPAFASHTAPPGSASPQQAAVYSSHDKMIMEAPGAARRPTPTESRALHARTAPLVGQGIPRAPLLTAAFAVVVAIGTSQTWVHAFIFSIAGTDTDRGIITLIAALTLAGLCGWKAFLGMRDGFYLIGSILLSVVMVSMPLWFLIDILNEPPTEFFDAEVRLLNPSWSLFLTVIAASAVVVSILAQLGARVLQGRRSNRTALAKTPVGQE